MKIGEKQGGAELKLVATGNETAIFCIWYVIASGSYGCEMRVLDSLKMRKREIMETVNNLYFEKVVMKLLVNGDAGGNQQSRRVGHQGTRMLSVIISYTLCKITVLIFSVSASSP